MTKNPDNAVLGAAVVTLSCTMAGTMLPKDLGGKQELPTAKMMFGSALTFMGLSIMADFAPSVAVPLSWCLAVTALTFYGVPIADNYFNSSQKGK